ncbi:hypothetical protein AG1IA_01694 [Rhizoctonia solani AG-1 IA]|uniref:Uncharacterized protein n=1 Tax=Thanatephorus cucumeris (strain AG1-IA) TaxID=983506 RepID=L8X5C8_THACA|nr:hypothetical protein AG1IA_01694 [Rhizoctonia solani AG-1 IA]
MRKLSITCRGFKFDVDSGHCRSAVIMAVYLLRSDTAWCLFWAPCMYMKVAQPVTTWGTYGR